MSRHCANPRTNLEKEVGQLHGQRLQLPHGLVTEGRFVPFPLGSQLTGDMDEFHQLIEGKVWIKELRNQQRGRAT